MLERDKGDEEKLAYEHSEEGDTFIVFLPPAVVALAAEAIRNIPGIYWVEPYPDRIQYWPHRLPKEEHGCEEPAGLADLQLRVDRALREISEP